MTTFTIRTLVRTTLSAIAMSAVLSGEAPAQPAKSQENLLDRINILYFEGFCRAPRVDEVAYWLQDNRASDLGIIYTAAREWLQKRDPEERRATIVRSYHYMMNRDPRPDELAFWDNAIIENGVLCFELNEAHRDWQKRDAALRNPANPQ